MLEKEMVESINIVRMSDSKKNVIKTICVYNNR